MTLLVSLLLLLLLLLLVSNSKNSMPAVAIHNAKAFTVSLSDMTAIRSNPQLQAVPVCLSCIVILFWARLI